MTIFLTRSLSFGVLGSNSINEDEITSAMVQLGISAFEDDIEDLIQEFDRDRSGDIDIYEFFAIIEKYKENDNSFVAGIRDRTESKRRGSMQTSDNNEKSATCMVM